VGSGRPIDLRQLCAITRTYHEAMIRHAKKEMTMPAKAARAGATRRSSKLRAGGAQRARTDEAAAIAGGPPEAEDWVEPEGDNERLAEGEMEILLTGHAATHGIEGEDNWLIESEQQTFGER
jgi:hypothetical protein